MTSKSQRALECAGPPALLGVCGGFARYGMSTFDRGVRQGRLLGVLIATSPVNSLSHIMTQVSGMIPQPFKIRASSVMDACVTVASLSKTLLGVFVPQRFGRGVHATSRPAYHFHASAFHGLGSWGVS